MDLFVFALSSMLNMLKFQPDNHVAIILLLSLLRQACVYITSVSSLFHVMDVKGALPG